MWKVRIRVSGEMGEGRRFGSEKVRAVEGMFGLLATKHEDTRSRRDTKIFATKDTKDTKPENVELGIDSELRHVLWEEEMEVEVGAGEVVLISGASGAGKSTLLRRVEEGLRNEERRTMNDEGGRGFRVVRLEEIRLEADRALVDCFDLNLQETLKIVARAGLSEARVWTRAPWELSAGEQFRYRLARFMAGEWDVLIADAFCEAIDDVTARVVSWKLGEFVRGSVASARPRAAVVATVRRELSEDLRPARWVELGDVN